MAELVGTAEIRVDMNTRDAARSIRAMVSRSDGPLRNFKDRIGDVADELDRVRTVARDISVSARLDNQLSAGAAQVRNAVDDLGRLGPVRIGARVDDDTAPGIASVRASVDRLRALGSVQITVNVQARAQQLTTAAVAVGRLREGSEDAGRALTALGARATAAAAQLNGLREAAQGAARALRVLSNRADNVAGRFGDLSGRTRTLRGDMDDLDASVRRLGPGLNGLRGRLGTLGGSAGGAGDRMSDVRAVLLSLATAAIPAAASLAPIAGYAMAAGVAVGALGLAMGKQVASVAAAAKAETKYKEAVREHGRTSKQAAEASNEYAREVARMPAPTRTAAAALSSLKTQYTGWSNALAKDTMPVFTRGLQTASALLPKFTPLVKTAASGLDRLIKIAAGGIRSPGMDALIQKVNALAGTALRRATDGLLSFIRSAQTGSVGGGVSSFMAYARANGPLAGETLRNLGSVLLNLVEAASGVGVGMLTVVNAFARLVNAVPQGLLNNLVQVYITFRLIKLAAAGMIAMNAGLAAMTGHIVAMRTAAAGATGRMASLRAGLAAMPGGAKFALAAVGVAVLTVGISKLVSKLDEAPPSAEKLSRSMIAFARTGKIGGEAARAFGKDLSGFGAAVGRVAHPSVMERIKDVGHTIVTLGLDTEAGLDKSQKSMQAVDKALSDLVSKGHTDIAAMGFKRYAAAAAKSGTSTEKLRGMMPKYKEALANAKAEQELVAQSMGLFGNQAIKTKTKLEAQKASADGLRQAIQALNEVNRASLGGMIAFEASIDTAAKAAKENAGSLRMVNGQLDVNSPKAQAAASALQDLATKTDEAGGAARESGKSWSTVSGIYERGRQKLITYGMQMGLTRGQATKLASEILKIPNKKTTLKGDVSDLSAKISKAKAQLSDKNIPKEKKARLTADIKRWNEQLIKAKVRLLMTPTKREARLTANVKDWRAKIASAEKQLKTAKGTKRAKLTGDIKDWKAKVASAERQLKKAKSTKTAKLRGDIKDWTAKLEAAKRRLKSVPPGKKAKLRAEIGDLLAKVRRARAALAKVTDKSVTIRTNYVSSVKARKGATFAPGGSYWGRRAKGGPIKRASGGPIQGFPGGGLLRGPGTSTSDSIPVMGSDGEFMMRTAAVKHYGEPFMDAINSMQLPARGTAHQVGTGGATATAGRSVEAPTVVNNFYFTNEGVIGSQRELEDWFVRAYARAQQQRRVP
ncbi:hypothetical protein [Streptomyces iconiensis]|uniref:Uncharacterized protein n=1 Tax=Streptomyces iconiensis TaxID=1384038 RepID=A0ABT6ZSB8_9ACTN|nr:hypothetical protein [Streptomyces iconiensis]MDJ1131772.1 hypothetical protein [Streptomyces iconiensis]